MKTIQKTIWMRYLVIGVITSLITMGFSCKKIVDYGKTAEYVFINTTSHNITYMNELEGYNIGPNSTIINKIASEGAKNMQASQYMSAFGDNEAYKSSGRKFIIKFNGNKCWQPSFEGEHSPLDIKSYVAEKLGNNNFRFTYTYTETDYNRAVTCP